MKIAYARTHITHTHTHARTRTPLAPPHTHTHTHGPTGPSTRGGPVHPWEDGRLGGGPGDGQHASHACPRSRPHADAWRANPTGHGGSGGPPAALAHSSCIGSVPGAIGAGCDEPDRSHRRQRAARQRASTSHATHPPMPPLRHAPHTCGLPAAHPSCPQRERFANCKHRGAGAHAREAGGATRWAEDHPARCGVQGARARRAAHRAGPRTGGACCIPRT